MSLDRVKPAYKVIPVEKRHLKESFDQRARKKLAPERDQNSGLVNLVNYNNSRDIRQQGIRTDISPPEQPKPKHSPT